MEKNIKVAAGNQTGTDVSVVVHFEPCQVGDIQSKLTISSDFGGEYVFPLYGTCTPPKPQGPLIISLGSSVSISFKNVFQQTTTFSFQVDNPAFTVKGAETISPQKTQHIQVTFDGPPTGSRGPCHGKLTISCPRIEGHGQGIFWVYYLKGYCPELPSEKKTSWRKRHAILCIKWFMVVVKNWLNIEYCFLKNTVSFLGSSVLNLFFSHKDYFIYFSASFGLKEYAVLNKTQIYCKDSKWTEKINISVALRFAVWITPVIYQVNCCSFWVLFFSPPGGALVALTSPLTCPIYWGMMGGIFPLGSWLKYRYFVVVCDCFIPICSRYVWISLSFSQPSLPAYFLEMISTHFSGHIQISNTETGWVEWSHIQADVRCYSSYVCCYC